jgi:5-methylcytosine-specific restriction protein A
MSRYNPRFERQRSNDKPWRNWYMSSRWRARRAKQLAKQPLCESCLARGRYVKATVVHHLEPHRGDPIKFWKGELRSDCKPCHDKWEQQVEQGGYSRLVGEDGYPLDPKHPFYLGGGGVG